jgi:hypothetical protein
MTVLFSDERAGDFTATERQAPPGYFGGSEGVEGPGFAG